MNESEDTCVYCNSPKECREHVIPLIFLGITRNYNSSQEWIMPACNRCNILAGPKVFFSIPEKAKYILSRYKIKHKKQINMPEWTQDELDDMDYLMREMIFAGLTAKRVLLEKIKHLEDVAKLPLNYKRPEFIELRIKELLEKEMEINKKLKKKNKNVK